MKERPILFSSPMVRAILEGSKTQTRRVVKGLPGTDPIACPYGGIGDQLWVKETVWVDADTKEFKWYAHQRIFKVDRVRDNARLWPSIHMKRAWSRIQLEITGIRVERLQDISVADAIEEGLTAITKDGGQTTKYGIPDLDGMPGNDDTGWPWHEWRISPVDAYRHLWETINGEGSWDANPWVWVVELKVIKQ
jgi:hypothetical protein